MFKDYYGHSPSQFRKLSDEEIDKALRFQLSLEEATIHIGTAAENRPDVDLIDWKLALVEQERDLYKKLYEQLLERFSGATKNV